jgi:chemotaxis response regulator CheB
MVIDDEANARSALRELLTEAGYEVLARPARRDTIDAARRFQPDVVLLDIERPESPRLREALRALLPPSAVILISRSSGSATDRDYPVLRKPLKLAELFSTVGAAAGGATR